MSDLSDRIRATVAEQLEIKEEKVTEDAKIMDDLGADSLDIIELISIMEEEFGIEIPDEDEDRIITVRDLGAYIEQKTAQK